MNQSGNSLIFILNTLTATSKIIFFSILSHSSCVIKRVAINVFKIKNKLFPDWFMQFPTNNEILQNRCITRQQHNLYVSHTNTDHGGRSLRVLGPKIWNALPDNVTSSLTLQVFRKRLKAFLMNNDGTHPLNSLTYSYYVHSITP